MLSSALSNFRKLLIIGGIVGISLIVWAVHMAMRSDDFSQKLLLTIIDKVVLGCLVILVGYFFQRRLEVYKRDQSFTSELAKARIAAYNRAFSAVDDLAAVGGVLLELARNVQQPDQEKIREMHEEFEKTVTALIALMRTDRYLLGPAFKGMVTLYAKRFRADVRDTLSDTPTSAEEYALRTEKRDHIRESLEMYLPKFARIPKDDPHFSNPDLDSYYLEMLEEDQQTTKE